MATVAALGNSSDKKRHELIYVDPHSVSVWWPWVEELMRRGRKAWEAYYDEDFAKAQVLSGRWQAWLLVEETEPYLMAFTSIEDYPKLRTLRFILLAGKRRGEMEKFDGVLREWAHRYGAVIIEADMRPGLARWMQRKGFKCESMRMVRSIASQEELN